MPTDTLYDTSDLPDSQKYAVKAIANRILRKYGIESAALRLTNVDLPEELVINTSNLHFCASLPPTSSALLPEMELLESLVSRFSNILIIPLWVVDLYMAAHGDRAAVRRSVERINPRRLPPTLLFQKKAEELGVSPTEARLELTTDVVLQVLAHRHEALPIWSASNPAPLQHPDGNAETAVPNRFAPWTFRQWVEFQTIRGTRDILDGLPLHVDILINAPEIEGGPSQLWWYPELPPLSHGGRPSRDAFGGTIEGFMACVGPAIIHLSTKGDNPTMAAVAELIDLSEDTLTRAIRRYKFPNWEGVVIRANNESGQG